MSKYTKKCTKNFELLVTNIVKCIVYLLCTQEKFNQKKNIRMREIPCSTNNKLL